MFAPSAAAAGRSPAEEAAAAAAGKAADPGWAWAPFQPDAERPWNLRWAGHLYRRAAFGATWDQLQRALANGPQRTVDKLLHGEGDVAAFNHTYDQYEAAAGDSGSTDGLRAWWLRRMILTPHPLLEKMTLFWHSHFAASNDKVQSALLMHRHVQLLRSHALGAFEPLLMAVARDPAALLCLDANANRQARPNDHFARALLESFSLGPGRCSQQDIREVARAFTGWFVLQRQFRFVEHEHDFARKRILGREGNFDGEEVVRIVLRQPETPRFLVRKLYRWLIAEAEEPDEGLIAPLAESFAKDDDLSKLVETMLRSNWFFSPASYRRRVKGPIEFALGIIRGLEELVPTAPLGQDLAALGQNLYHPPGIKGWDGGRAWINRSTLLGRSNLALSMLAGAGPYGEKLDPWAVARNRGFAAAAAAGQFLLDLFLQGDAEPQVAETLLTSVARPAAAADGDAGRWLRELAHGVVCLPEFQLA
jgi:uncharacterized protein (DUF1800 family)